MKRALGILLIFALMLTLAACGGSKKVKEDEKAKADAAAAAAQPAVAASTLLTVRIAGATYATLTDFKGKVGAIKGIKNIYQNSFNKDEATIMQVEYSGSTQTLADAIQALKVEKYTIEVQKFDPSSVELKFY
ncbi:hypothetical protein FDZ71_02550 [bacterium]|nr:MAG: hypothetical protein FDZ71_02550 [bacterium]